MKIGMKKKELNQKICEACLNQFIEDTNYYIGDKIFNDHYEEIDVLQQLIKEHFEPQLNQTYRHAFIGDFYRKRIVDGKLYDDHDYYNFQIEVQIPINYDTKEAAISCPCSLRFEKEDGHAVLRIYSEWQQGFDKNGKWLEHVDGNVIETIRWEEHWKYKISRSKVIAKEMGGYIDGNTDYLPDATPWDELFDIKNQLEGWRNTVESLAYCINILDLE